MGKISRKQGPTVMRYPLGLVPSGEGDDGDAAPTRTVQRPTVKASKGEWETYAAAVGVDPAGLSKKRIIKATQELTG